METIRQPRHRPPSPLAVALALVLALTVLQALPAAAGDAGKGRAIAEKLCSRCHVVGAHNRYGGIGSTASFQMIAKMSDYLERFRTFYARRPHPAFVTVPGVPAWSERKTDAYATAFTVTLDEVDDIVAFVRTLEPMPIRRKGK